ncbi:histone deacetylase [candidate division KSB1 bacterium]|nr:histone deacetylase [candidate division KSB1 bacterium]
MPFIYSPRYYADIGIHVFPVIKYQKVYEKLTREASISETEFLIPGPATDEQLLLVHTPEYLEDLKNCAWTPRTFASELPISNEIVELFVLSAGGTILACQKALQAGWAVHLCGGFHHAFADKAEGFCYINDLAVGVRVLQKDGGIQKAAVIDCDLHQGNGTAVIFQDDKSVFTFSIHQHDLYPIKERSDLDIHLPIGVTDDVYMRHLEENIPRILDEFKPELVLYQAGGDPYEQDQLGSLALSIEGLKARDTFIFHGCRKRDIPIAVTLGGGYAIDTDDTVQIHVNTCRAAMEVFSLTSE